MLKVQKKELIMIGLPLAVGVAFVFVSWLAGDIGRYRRIPGFAGAVLVLLYGSVLAGDFIPEDRKKMVKALLSVAAIIILSSGALILIETPLYVDAMSEARKLMVVIVVHPLLQLVASSLTITLTSPLFKEFKLKNSYIVYCFVKCAFALYGRFFLFNLNDVSVQIGAVVFLSFIEIITRIVAPFRRYLMWYVLSGGDRDKAYSKLEGYRTGRYYSHITYIDQFTEFWSVIFAATVSIWSQSERGIESAQVKVLALAIAVQIVGELISDTISLQVDTLYHEKQDMRVWMNNTSNYTINSILCAVCVCAFANSDFAAVSDSFIA